MTILQWLQTYIPLGVGIVAILSAIAGLIYNIHKKFHNFIKDEIESVAKEFKPNGGSSLKDQVNRLEVQHNNLSDKVDKIYEILIDKFSK